MPNYKSIRISSPAKRDLQLIAKYTEKKWGLSQKQNYLSLFKHFFKKLISSGNIGKQRDDITIGLFSYPIKKHIVFFRESDNEFTVIRILHVRMNVEKNLKEM